MEGSRVNFSISFNASPCEKWIRKSNFTEWEVIELTSICIEISDGKETKFITPESFFCDYRRKE